MSIRFRRMCSALLPGAAQTCPAAAEISLAAPPRLVPVVEQMLASVVCTALTGSRPSDHTPLLAEPFLSRVVENFGQLAQAKRPFKAANDAAAPGDLVLIAAERPGTSSFSHFPGGRDSGQRTQDE